MSDSFSLPYRSPENTSVPESQLNSTAALSDTMLNYLKQASPWMRFSGILGFIACGLMVFGGVISAVILFIVYGLDEELAGLPAVFAVLFYVPLGLLYFFPSRFIYNFGTKIRSYIISNSNEDLELAFKYNKSYWKFIGILCIVGLAAFPGVIILSIIGGIAAVITGLFS